MPSAGASASATPPAASSASSVAPKPSKAPTPLPRAAGYTWRAGDRAWIAGDIVVVPGGYLATCTDEGGTTYTLCSSHDLIAWSSPADAAVFAGPAGGDFLPTGVLAVKNGFGAESDIPSRVTTEWYSADGLTWQKGIPAAQAMPDVCVPNAATGGGCLPTDWIVSNPKTGVSLAWCDHQMYRSNNAWATQTRVWANLIGVPDAPEVMADGTWITHGFWSDEQPQPGDPGVGDAPEVLVTSKDGTHWSTIDSTPDGEIGTFDVVGKDLFATFLSDAGEALTYDVYESRDGGKTWPPVQTAAGEQIQGQYVQGFAGRVVVTDDDPPMQIQWVGAP